MLKIKDNVDLKELEKFGFKQVKDGHWEEWIYLGYKTTYFYRDSNRRLRKDVSSELIKVDRYRTIVINMDIKIFPKEEIYGYGGWTTDLEPIYDLIKADMVEKVEE